MDPQVPPAAVPPLALAPPAPALPLAGPRCLICNSATAGDTLRHRAMQTKEVEATLARLNAQSERARVVGVGATPPVAVFGEALRRGQRFVFQHAPGARASPPSDLAWPDATVCDPPRRRRGDLAEVADAA